MYSLYLYSSSYDYTDVAAAHNNRIQQDPHPDAGFNIWAPTDVRYSAGDRAKTFNTGIHAKMVLIDRDLTTQKPCTFTVEPRSSICKTPLRMSNTRGIIDSGYRGELLVKADSHEDFTMLAGTSYFQILSPTLDPFRVIVVQSLEDLGDTTRGSGGFGSTGGN